MVLQPTKTGFIFEKKGRAALTSTGWSWAIAAPAGCDSPFPIRSVSDRVATSSSLAWWCRKITTTAASSSGVSAAYRAGSAICGASCTATAGKAALGGAGAGPRGAGKPAPNARDHEYLYQHDVGLSRLRRMMQKAAKEQLAMREAQQGAA